MPLPLHCLPRSVFSAAFAVFFHIGLPASLFIGCTASMTAAPLSEPVARAASLQTLVGSRWVVQALQGTVLTVTGAMPRLQFISLTQVGGFGGCNNFGGEAVMMGNLLKLGPLAATRKFCVGPAMATETQFFKALDSVRSARTLDGVVHALELMDAEGVVVVRLTQGA
jgi:heat shock protein HslJ